MPKYSIAICNYNMGDTIGDALNSILEQLDDRFEVVVVDDGSSDQSVEVLRRKAEEEDALRVLTLPRSKSRKLGVTRNISVHAADGEYVLLHVDADDTFDNALREIVEIFEVVDDHVPKDFYFMSCGFSIAKREFLLEHGPYRNLPVGGEDQDMWRRLLADDAVINVDSRDIYEEIGYQKDRTALAKRWFRVAVSNFQTGISYRSYLEWSHENRSTLGTAYDFFFCAPLAYLLALTRESYDLPEEYRSRGRADERLAEIQMTLPELEEQYGFHIDRDALSARTRELYKLD